MLDDGTRAASRCRCSTSCSRPSAPRSARTRCWWSRARCSSDDFSGGLRITADRLLTLAEARGRFARRSSSRLNGEVKQAGGGNAAADKLRAHARSRSATARARCGCATATRWPSAELPLGDAWRVRLDDQLPRRPARLADARATSKSSTRRAGRARQAGPAAAGRPTQRTKGTTRRAGRARQAWPGGHGPPYEAHEGNDPAGRAVPASVAPAATGRPTKRTRKTTP
ncbi:MAG: hypothetical protein MZW92_60695 [Comamonadaceae bacterium]|nr:hypothetical protein [Comamonadaceae bacterium]